MYDKYVICDIIQCKRQKYQAYAHMHTRTKLYLYGVHMDICVHDL